MVADASGKPEIRYDGFGLGAIALPTRKDIRVDAKGMVNPNSGGMSTFTDPNEMPPQLKPRALKGQGTLPLWELDTADIHEGLQTRETKRYHVNVEPRQPMTLAEYQALLAWTRDSWKV